MQSGILLQPWILFLQLLFSQVFLQRVASEDGEHGEKKSTGIIQELALCENIDDGIAWSDVFDIAKRGCWGYDRDSHEEVLRIICDASTLSAVIEAAQIVVDESSVRIFSCPNGMSFVLAVTLAYAREALSPKERARAYVLLWDALQENFLMDATAWPVKTHDVLQVFDLMPPALSLAPLGEFSAQLVTLIVPRCPPELLEALRNQFASVTAHVGLVGAAREPDTPFPGHWLAYAGAENMPTSLILNSMLADVDTPLVLVVLGSALPDGMDDLERLANTLRQRRLIAASGPLVDKDRVYVDFCHKLRPRHYRLSFDQVYSHSVIMNESSAISIRGKWFSEGEVDSMKGPCKLCDTLPPTFLARTEALQAFGFTPGLDGEWSLLDLAIRISRTPLLERGPTKESRAPPQHGMKNVPGSFGLCPFVQLREVAGLEAPHLYGRSETWRTGVSPAAPWYGYDSSALGAAGGGAARSPHFLTPYEQAKRFMTLNHLKYITGPDGIERYFGCNLHTTNCPVSEWVYRGWAIPPCCKETMRRLLFYISDVFREMGIRYIVTDGVLLGSYKFGGMLDWDADVDLHIHTDDFPRLESEVQARVARDGHFLRKHPNNRSWLLQANNQNYLLIELNLRDELWEPEKVWYVPIEGRLFPAMEEAHRNLSQWYGLSFFKHRLRHVPEWEEQERPMYCATPYHYNCVDETQVPSGRDCLRAGLC